MSDNIDISTGIPKKSLLSPILYLFYNADLIEICYNTDLIEICCITNKKITSGGFIDDVFLLATSLNILQNCQLLNKTHLLYISRAKQNASKLDQAKYQLVHL